MYAKISTLIAEGMLIAALASSVDTQYDDTYVIDRDGVANINRNIRIINKLDSATATSYKINVKQMRIYDIYGSGEKGPLKLEVSENPDSSTTITATPDEPAIGEGRYTKFNVGYKSKDVATKSGEMWNLQIPRTEISVPASKYDTTVKIHKSLGPKVFISPAPIDEFEEQDYTTFKFDVNSGITASFGQYQMVNFKLKYKLKNDFVVTTLRQISLPPDIPERQQIIYTELTPKPIEIVTDEDGNSLAKYMVRPKETLDISFTGSAKITGRQIQPKLGGKFENIPKNLTKRYTKSDKYWEVGSPELKKTADSLMNKNLTVAQNAQSVYDFITENLRYDFDIVKKDYVERRGALSALTSNLPGACMEFTDLFIALTRAMGIPSRELNGYAFTKEGDATPLSINLKGGDFLHAWPEFYDPNFGWVQVDPTWGATSKVDYFTKLDTGRLIFAVKGMDSESPLPAGTYKLEGTEHQVDVDFSQTAVNIKESVVLYKAANINPVAWIQGKEKFIAVNDGNTSIFDTEGSGEPLPPLGTQTIYLPKGDFQIRYRDFDGGLKVKTAMVEKNKPESLKSRRSSIFLYATFLAALLLCTICYLLLIYPAFRQRLSRLLRLLLRVPNRSRSRN